jgi:hypothetical protein
MVVDNFHFARALLGPAEAESVLLVDSNAVLSLAVAGERFKAIARR